MGRKIRFRKKKIAFSKSARLLFIKYQPLCRKLALKHSRSCGRSFDELLNEAQSGLALLLCRKLKNFDPKKSKELTWIYSNVNWHLYDYRKREGRAMREGRMARDLDFDLMEDRRNRFLDSALVDMGSDARALVKTFCNPPASISGQVKAKSPEAAKRAVRSFLIHNEGWTGARLNRAWEEVGSYFQGAELCVSN